MTKKKHRALKIFLTPWIVLVLLYHHTCFASIRVTDSQGNHLVLEQPPNRVVSLVPAATETLFALGTRNAIVGLTSQDTTLEGATNKSIMGNFFLPSIKQINKDQPDLIILAPFQKQIMEALKKTGTSIFIYDTISIAQSYDNILALGKLFNRQTQAQKVVQQNKLEIEHIEKKLARAVPNKRKRVLRFMGRDKIMIPGNPSFQNELIRLSGGITPDFGKKGNAVDINLEEWIKFNPEVIYGCNDDRATAQAFFSQPGWKDVDAVKNHQIYYFPQELTSRASTHSGYFISWLAATIYTKEFANPENNILQVKITRSRPINLDLSYVKSAAINYCNIYDFTNKTLLVDFKEPQTIVSTLEGPRDNILTVGNHYSPAPTWAPGHRLGIEDIRANILKANERKKATTSFLITGADMDNLSIIKQSFKKMKVTAIVTAGVLSNACRMSKDTGMFYEPGTINILILTNMQLSKRAMTRAILTATEAKTAALEDMDIRSSYTPLINGATGTGTDNVLVVQGKGVAIQNAGGHSKMGELIAKAVYAGVKQAVLKQNKISADRHIFQRLKERRISLYNLASKISDNHMPGNAIFKTNFTRAIEHLMLEKKYAAFLESALAVSDAYEKNLIEDLTFFQEECRVVASQIAGKKLENIQNILPDQKIPLVLKTALNAIFTGTLEKLDQGFRNLNGKYYHE
ncbi:MAG: ABC transporter substrate-binding protein [Desulfobacteraceae bacterium]|nr:ABC transporter substrate-binding protein [Desulfobacteraceae bacterium]